MSKKKSIILSVITIITLVLLVVGATYAYFKAQGGDPKSADIKVSSYTVDTFTFSIGNPISFTLDQDNFASGKGNRVGNTFAKVNLTANNKTNTATEHYYMYLNIENNTFTYSIDESTPEIIMTVTDSTGTEITDIAGLTHTSVKDASGTSISGYDITNKNGLITLFNNREITATPSKEEKWNIAVTFVNYDASQNNNAGKSMSAKVMVQKEKIVQTVANICQNGQSLSSCIVAMNGIDDTLYYHDSSLANGAGDSSYRYSGANPNNYVCFGSSESPCPTDNLYRIIGVFEDKVKLIKYDYATSALLGTNGDYNGTGTSNSSYYKGSLTTINIYYWNKSTYSNTWSESNLNKTNLNTNFITNIGTEWANKIIMTTWKVGGNTNANIRDTVPATAYQNEIVNPSVSTTYDAKIGLMYASDYGFAADPSAWTTTLYNYAGSVNGSTIRSLNWMHMGYSDWTISPTADYFNVAFGVDYVGNVGYGAANGSSGVRPSFNLESSITYVSGSGSADDPMVIN